MRNDTKERIDHIDGLRAVAVLSVVLFHAGVHNSATRGASGFLVPMLQAGCHGVDLFFVLSGFCLAYPTLCKLRARGESQFNVVSFAARRVLRILPPYYAAVALFALVAFAVLRTGGTLPGGMDISAFSASGIMQQLLFLDADHKYLDASFWTLAIEFRWYFLFPVLLWVWTRSKAAFALIGILILCATGTRMRGDDLLFLPTFMFGIAAADLYTRQYRIPRFAYLLLPITFAIAFVSTAKNQWGYFEAGPFWGIAMFCLVVAAGANAGIRRILSSRLLVFIGFASYGIYLVHEPVIGLIEQHAGRLAPGFVLYALMCAGALAAGLLFSGLAERPFLSAALKRRCIPVLERVFSRVFVGLAVEPLIRMNAPRHPRVARDVSGPIAIYEPARTMLFEEQEAG